MSLHDMRNELRALRKDAVKPVSKMRKGDVSAEIEKLKGMRESTPASASIPSAPVRKSKAAVESIKAAKASEFPIAPAPKGAKSEKAKAPVKEAPKKKESKMERLMKLAETMSDTDEE